MATAAGNGSGLQANMKDLQQAARQLTELSATVHDLVAKTSAASSAAASACPAWRIGAASSAAGARWYQAVTAQAAAVGGAGDRLAASAAIYGTAETALVQKISAIGQPAAF
jgi:hypothetical protein